MADGINQPLSRQVKMDKIAKNMISNANSAKKSKMDCVIFARTNMKRVYILTR